MNSEYLQGWLSIPIQYLTMQRILLFNFIQSGANSLRYDNFNKFNPTNFDKDDDMFFSLSAF